MKHYKKIILALSLSITACNAIPSAYVGDYSDAATGLLVNLRSNKITIQRQGERKATKLDPMELKSDNLLRGRMGAYYTPSRNDEPMDVFLVTPNMTTRQQEGDIVWFQAEIARGVLDPKVRGQVAILNLEYCQQGIVEVDTVSKAVQLGCPGESAILDLIRVGGRR